MVLKSENFPWPLYAVHRQPALTQLSLKDRINKLFKDGFDSTIIPLFSDDYIQQQIDDPHRQQNTPLLDLDKSTIPADEGLESRSHLKNIMLEINSCIRLDHPQAVKVFQFIIGYAAYLGSYAFMMHLPRDASQKKAFTSKINQMAKNNRLARMHIILNVDLGLRSSAWEEYIEVRASLTNQIPIDLMLTFGEEAPSQREIARWIGQRIDYINLKNSCFVANNKGFPVLPNKAETILKQLFRHKTKVVLSSSLPNTQQHLKFIQFLFQKSGRPSQKQLAAMNIYDYLQTPLQPYYDQLESDTYYVFETDNAKYDEYQLSLYQAFLSFKDLNKKICIYYIGSGRGGLIYSAFNASKKANRKIYIYAIQKNPYPIQSLKKRIRENKWEHHVEIVYTDVKTWTPPQPADIFLSQLLGGFGDNQLSPQCLAWAQKHLTKDTICIPREYSSYICPVSCSSLYRQLAFNQRQNYYVVNLHNHSRVSHVQKCWTFWHPTPKEQDFTRSHTAKFKFTQTDLVHGFAGYFSCELFGSSRYSTHPEEHTPDMYSWFPMFFAFSEVLRVTKQDELQIVIRRRSDERKVWYQWDVNLIKDGLKMEPLIHNRDGSVHAIYK